MKAFRFFKAAVAMRISEEMAYKFNFLLRILTLMTFDFIMPFITILVYLNSNGFAGWDFSQILLFQGVFIMVNALDRMFFQRVDWSLSYDVRSGSFDRYLLFPVNTLAYISFINFGLEHVADFFIGIAVIIYSVARMPNVITLSNILFFIGFIMLALIFVLSLAILKYSIIIRAVRIGRLGEFFRTIKEYGQYPVDIYGSFLSSVFRYIIPLTILAYYPSSALLNKGSQEFLLIAGIIIAFFILCHTLWKRTLKYYTSAGG